jgi:hypothetical protein
MRRVVVSPGGIDVVRVSAFRVTFVARTERKIV